MSRTSLASAQAAGAGPASSVCARRFRRRVAPRSARRGGSSRVSVSIVVAASDRFGGGAPPPNRLDEQAARGRVYRLASETTGGRGAMEAIQGCLSSMPGMTNHRLMLFRHPSLKCPLDTVALNLVEPRWVVAFDAIANAPKRPGDPPFCFGITHPALVPATTPPGEDVVPPKPGDVGLVCQVDDVYHDNKTERMYVTSRVVGRFAIERVVGEHPFFVAETRRLIDDSEGADRRARKRWRRRKRACGGYWRRSSLCPKRRAKTSSAAVRRSITTPNGFRPKRRRDRRGTKIPHPRRNDRRCSRGR